MGKREIFWAVVSLVGVACSGSTTGERQQDPEALISDLCDKILGLNCPDSLSDATECKAVWNEERTEAAAKGCDDEFDAMMNCYLTKLTSCDQNGKDICAAAEATSNCMEPAEYDGGGMCSQGFGGAPAGAPSYYQKCDVDCSTWGASCETVSSPTHECTCTKGPNVGKAFSAPTCLEGFMAYAEDQCA
jgi:hypothetical protein